MISDEITKIINEIDLSRYIFVALSKKSNANEYKLYRAILTFAF